MRILVLGGTAWLGHAVAEAALERGHQVTCLARASSGTPPAGTRLIRADRDRPDAHDAVRGEDWDAVVDVARQPGHVRRSVQALRDVAGHYVLVSTVSVYAEHAVPGQDEDAPVLAPLDADLMESMETYGEAKVACERHVLDGSGAERSLVARAGLIAGPGDVSDRTGYWPLRMARPAVDDGRVLVPDTPELGTQVVDVRDLAGWLVESGCRRRHGTINAIGDSVPLHEHLATARAVAGERGRPVPAAPAWLAERGVAPWMGERSLPLWLPAEMRGHHARDSGRARAAGLRPRPLSETLADTLAWELGRGEDRGPRRAGLSEHDERALLEELTPGSAPSGRR